LTGWLALKYDEMTEDMQIRNVRTGLLAIIGLKRYSRFTIVDETGHVETFNKTDAEDWTKV
jgi:hypothetical protein